MTSSTEPVLVSSALVVLTDQKSSSSNGIVACRRGRSDLIWSDSALEVLADSRGCPLEMEAEYYPRLFLQFGQFFIGFSKRDPPPLLLLYGGMEFFQRFWST